MVNLKLKKIGEIFQRVQVSLSTHKKSCKLLQKIYQETHFEDFIAEFIKYLKALLHDDKFTQNPYVNKALNFCVKFCISLDKHNKDDDVTCPFLAEVFRCVLELHNVEAARYRACCFINMLLREMGENESFLDAEICENIRDVMLERIEDIKPAVRYIAVEVMQRLQDPQDPDDVIIKSYIEHLPDNSLQVRRAIVQCIGLNMTTIPIIVGRCLDIDDSVRLASFERLAKIPIRALKLEHRQFVLRNGFKDKNPKVKQFLEKTLIPQWFLNCNENYFTFILALKLDADENDFKQTTKIVEQVLDIFLRKNDLQAVMEALPLGKEKLITTGEINWEEFIFWRYLVEFLRNEENELVDQILPELSFFCNYIKEVYKTRAECKTEWEKMHHDFIMLELLKICSGYDFSDEVGRNILYKLITYLFIDSQLSFENIELLMRIFEKLCTNIEVYANEVCSFISEIREPVEVQEPSLDMIRTKEVKCAEIRIKIDIARDEQEKAIEKKDFMKAQELKLKIKELNDNLTKINDDFNSQQNKVRVVKNDVKSLCKCLDLFIAMFKSRNINEIPKAAQLTLEQFVQPLLISTNTAVFSRALKVMGYCCSVDSEMARKSTTLFTGPLLAHKYMPMYDDLTTITVIECLTDLLMVYGAELLDSSDNVTLNFSKKTSKKRQLFTESQFSEEIIPVAPPTASYEVVIETLSDLLDDDVSEIRLVSGESLVKLMCTGRIRSPMLLTKLILKWFSPATAKDVRLRQFIGRIFVDYATEVPSSLEVIEQAFIPTLQTIMDAPCSSPLADIEIESTMRFLAQLSRPGNHKYNMGLDTHKNIALTLCQEICDRPNNKMTPIFLKALILLDAPYEDEVAICDLRKQVDLMFELIVDKTLHKYVLKYKNKLEGDIDITAPKNTTKSSEDVSSNTNINNNNISNNTVNTEIQNLNNENENNAVTSTPSTSRNILNPATLHVSEEEEEISKEKSPDENQKSTPSKPNKFASLSTSIKRRKRRSKRTGNGEVLAVLIEQNEEVNTPKNNKDLKTNQSKNNKSPQIVVTETDSDNVSVKSKHMKTTVRRSGRKRSNT